MGTTTIATDRFRRRRNAATAASAHAPKASTHPLVGIELGTIERRYGLMASEETIIVAEVLATSGDLAVADRLAFLATMERRTPVAVVEVDGWFIACITGRTMTPAEVAHLRSSDGAPRMMSLVTDRGITPALGPLCA